MAYEVKDGELVEIMKKRPHHGSGKRRSWKRKCMEKRTRPKKKGGKGK